MENLPNIDPEILKAINDTGWILRAARSYSLMTVGLTMRG